MNNLTTARQLAEVRAEYERGNGDRDSVLLANDPAQDEQRKEILAGLAGRIQRWFWAHDVDGETTSRLPEGDQGIISAAAAHQITWAQYEAARVRGVWIVFYESEDDRVGRVFPLPQTLTSDELNGTIPNLDIHHARMIQFPNGVKMDEPIPNDYEKYLKRLQADDLGFGEYSKRGLINADAMTLLIHDGKKWMDKSETVPLAKLALHPNMQAIHYGSALFEGMACEYNEKGEICMFDLKGHYERMMKGARDFAMPTIPFETFKEMVINTIKANKRFIPPCGKGRLYLRPNLVDIGPKMKVGPSKTLGMILTATPIANAGGYFGAMEQEVIFGIPRQKVRSAPGLTGDRKAGGNYAATILAIKLANSLGLTGGGVAYVDRLLSEATDDEAEAAEFRETNASNLLAFEKLEGDRWRIVTPPLGKDILDGRTRALIKRIALKLGWEFEEAPVTLKDIKSKRYEFMAGSGTAAYLMPIHGFQIFDMGSRKDLGLVDEEILNGLATKQEKYDYMEERVGQKSGKQIQIKGRKLSIEELVPDPIKRLIEEMAKVKRGESDLGDFEEDLTRIAA